MQDDERTVLNIGITAADDVAFPKVTRQDNINYYQEMVDRGRLIDLAPEMLRKLKIWVDWYEQKNGPLGLTPGRMLWEQTRDLIKRAEGKCE